MKIKWKELIQNLSNECEFYPSAIFSDIDNAERVLEVLLPDELKDILNEFNGVNGSNGAALIWPVERIVKDNLEFRQSSDFKELYTPFDHLLFFADTGNGDQFAFAILVGVIRWPNIFVWNHEDDSRTWVAPSLQTYLEWSSNGQIEV